MENTIEKRNTELVNSYNEDFDDNILETLNNYPDNIDDCINRYISPKGGNHSLPYSMSEKKISKFFEAIYLGASYDTASAYAEISQPLLTQWLKRAKEDLINGVPNSPYVVFMIKLKKVEADFEVELLRDMKNLINDRDPFLSHLLKYMSVKFPKKWKTSN